MRSLHRFLLGGLALALLGLALTGQSRAQPQGVKGKALIVPIGGTIRLQMKSKKPIATVVNPKENVVSIRAVVGDPTTVLISGQNPDVTTVELTDEDGDKEVFEVIVQLDVEYLKTQLQRAVPTANITPIPVSGNTVILSGTVTRAEDVDIVLRVAESIGGIQIINALRVGGVQQVQLDVVVAAVSRSEFRRMAFDFLTNSRNFFLGSTGSGAAAPLASIGVGAPFSVAPALLGGVGSPNGAPSNVLFGVIHDSWGFLGFLQALRDENLVKTMASPRMVTLSGRPASFLVGGEQAVPVPAGLGQVGVQFEEFGTRLNFLPIVLGNGKIHLEVEPEVSALDAANGVVIGGTAVPGRTTSRVNTTVQMEAGQTFVIGGLIQRSVVGSTTKTPILGDLPFFGSAFSRKSFQEIEQELVIMVTPYLVDAQDCNQVTKQLPGEETRSPDDFELFLEGILEAPRGPRDVFQHHHYVPAYKNSPSAAVFPCAGQNDGLRHHGHCGYNSCGANCNKVGAPNQCQPGQSPIGYQVGQPTSEPHGQPAQYPGLTTPAVPSNLGSEVLPPTVPENGSTLPGFLEGGATPPSAPEKLETPEVGRVQPMGLQNPTIPTIPVSEEPYPLGMPIEMPEPLRTSGGN